MNRITTKPHVLSTLASDPLARDSDDHLIAIVRRLEPRAKAASIIRIRARIQNEERRLGPSPDVWRQRGRQAGRRHSSWRPGV